MGDEVSKSLRVERPLSVRVERPNSVFVRETGLGRPKWNGAERESGEIEGRDGVVTGRGCEEGRSERYQGRRCLRKDSDPILLEKGGDTDGARKRTRRKIVFYTVRHFGSRQVDKQRGPERVRPGTDLLKTQGSRVVLGTTSRSRFLYKQIMYYILVPHHLGFSFLFATKSLR